MPSVAVLLFLLAGFAAALLFLLLRGQPRRKSEPERQKTRAEQLAADTPRIYTESAFLLQKIDERRRIMDEYHHTKITDEYFELVFELQNGEMLRVSCSKTAYHDMPFRKTGILTYSNGRLMRFKTTEHVISDEYSLR
ncbi:MAG: hypothetical protein IJ644_05195 [Oscillospiraceae bacterium]|nr:hypothetical protein [Oscillospiraceae bacterium]